MQPITRMLGLWIYLAEGQHSMCETHATGIVALRLVLWPCPLALGTLLRKRVRVKEGEGDGVVDVVRITGRGLMGLEVEDCVLITSEGKRRSDAA